MTFKRIWIVAAVASLLGCTPEPEGSVAVDISKQLAWSEGAIAFDVEKQFVSAREKMNFDIVALVSARDDDGSLSCRVARSTSHVNRIWVDSSGNRWVRINGKSKITYRRGEARLETRIDGLSIADCNVPAHHNITLNVLFDARPRPSGWSGEGMHGFEVSLPSKGAQAVEPKQ